MVNVQSFLLQDPEHYLKFRKYIRNIIDLGKDKRLEEIRDSLDTLLEESSKNASETETAKSRPPPSDHTTTNQHEPKNANPRPARTADTTMRKNPAWKEKRHIGNGAKRRDNGVTRTPTEPSFGQSMKDSSHQ
ncbi:hypothetical protein B0T24DRAFT_638948 [Lasiosphaeria ovina]|uniref:Uncharacterized protein n=1 Tax=Lasiosphaeria ovina TaxID=92902 RepID=A0AAE0JW58_9PEZI|nr:hypothetical protein B0T24DRAFT_638948 [Lasiosphaeria ovina]